MESESASGEPSAEQDARHPAPMGSGTVSEALGGLLQVLFERGREEFDRMAGSGRTRLELRQLRRDQAVMYQKLGREVEALVAGGEVEHPGLLKGVERIKQQQIRIAETEQALRASGEMETSEEDESSESEGSEAD